MSSVAITIELDDQAVRQRLSEVFDRLSDPQPLLGAIGEQLVNSTQDRLGGGIGPDGTPWTPLAPATIRQRVKAGHTPNDILKASGALRGSVAYQVEGSALRVGAGAGGSDAWDYAAIHQLGGSIDRAERVGNLFGHEGVTVKAHSITIPSRPYLGISAEDERYIIELAQDWLATE